MVQAARKEPRPRPAMGRESRPARRRPLAGHLRSNPHPLPARTHPYSPEAGDPRAWAAAWRPTAPLPAPRTTLGRAPAPGAHPAHTLRPSLVPAAPGHPARSAPAQPRRAPGQARGELSARGGGARGGARAHPAGLPRRGGVGRDVRRGPEARRAGEGDLPGGRGGARAPGAGRRAAAPPAGLEGRQRGAAAALGSSSAGTALLPQVRPVSTGAGRGRRGPPSPVAPTQERARASRGYFAGDAGLESGRPRRRVWSCTPRPQTGSPGPGRRAPPPRGPKIPPEGAGAPSRAEAKLGRSMHICTAISAGRPFGGPVPAGWRKGAGARLALVPDVAPRGPAAGTPCGEQVRGGGRRGEWRGRRGGSPWERRRRTRPGAHLWSAEGERLSHTSGCWEAADLLEEPRGQRWQDQSAAPN